MSTWLITGATSGIGRALTRQAAAAGHRVIACGRNPEVLAELAAALGVETRCFDVTDATQAQAALAETDVDVVVLSAGVCEYVDIDAFEPALFKRVFETNFFGAVNCIAALLPSLKQGAQLVLVDSLARLLPFTRSQAYGASKAALFYLAQSLQVDMARHGVLVQSASPGFVRTPMTARNDFPMPMLISAEQAAERLYHGILAKRRHIYFPKLFSRLLRLLALLPDPVLVALCRRLTRVNVEDLR